MCFVFFGKQQTRMNNAVRLLGYITICLVCAEHIRLRCGHVCLVGIDVVHDDDDDDDNDPIIEQLTLIGD